jgi:hypothetical protein
MTNPSTRQRLLERVAPAVQTLTVAEGMSQKMLDALRGGAAPAARPLSESAFYGDERAILNDACGWSDEPIKVAMDLKRTSPARVLCQPH